MTPEEKAEALVKKMLSKSPNIQDGVSIIDAIQAKLCALIAVDEIIKNYDEKYKYCNTKVYWEEVKQELEKSYEI